ncbi:hypothetical protein D3C72_1578200 [compost metagenome]
MSVIEVHGVAFTVDAAGAADRRLHGQHTQIIYIDFRPRARNFHIAKPVNRHARRHVVFDDGICRVFIQTQRHRAGVSQPAVFDDPFFVLKPERQRPAHRAGQGKLFRIDCTDKLAGGDILHPQQRRIVLRHPQLLQGDFSAQHVGADVGQQQRVGFTPRVIALQIGGNIACGDLVYHFGDAQRDRAARAQRPGAFAEAERQDKIDAVDLVVGHPDAAAFHHAMTTRFESLPGGR